MLRCYIELDIESVIKHYVNCWLDSTIEKLKRVLGFWREFIYLLIISDKRYQFKLDSTYILYNMIHIFRNRSVIARKINDIYK